MPPALRQQLLATAELLMGMMRMDYEATPEERQVVMEAMRAKFALSETY